MSLEAVLLGGGIVGVLVAILHLIVGRARRDGAAAARSEVNAQAELELARRRQTLEPRVSQARERQRSEQLEAEGLRQEALRVAAEDLERAELELERRTGQPWLHFPRGEGPRGS